MRIGQRMRAAWLAMLLVLAGCGGGFTLYFGDGSSLRFEVEPTHRFDRAGSYTIVLRVSDDDDTLDASLRVEVIQVEQGDTSATPYGLGTFGSRSTPVAGAAIALAARKIAAHLPEVGENDLGWEIDRFHVEGDPVRHKTMKDIAWAACNNVPAGLEMGLEAVHHDDPPNFTDPFGIYRCVVDIDRATVETKARRFYALDDCGTRINPMIIEGQIHGGLTEGFAVAMGQQMPFDAQGSLLGHTRMDHFLPTAVETPKWETDDTVTPSPHHPIGAKGVAESPHVGSIPTFTAAVVDAFAHLGVTDRTMPHTSLRVWQQLVKSGVAL